MTEHEIEDAQAAASEDAPAAEAAAAVEAAPAADAPAAVAADAPAAEAAAPADAPAAEAAAPAGADDAAAPGAKKGKGARRGMPRRELGHLVVGEPMKGRVVGTAPFGAFVDIGATTDGLVHITELPGKRVQSVDEVLKSGDAVEVWVKEVDAGKNRISLTMKPPPERRLSQLSIGDVVGGTVTSVTQYGVFVDIRSDTEGLVHISEMSSGFVSRPEDVVKPGDEVEVRIKEIDRARNRISLSMVGLGSDAGREAAAAAGAQRGRSDDEDYAMPEEPEERHPTVVELALRRAMGEDVGDDGTVAGRKETVKRRDKAGLTDVYARMLEEYRDTNG